MKTEIAIRESEMLLEELDQKMNSVNKKTITSIKKLSGKDKLWMINYNKDQRNSSLYERSIKNTTFLKNGMVYTHNEWCRLEDCGVYENIEFLDAFELDSVKEVEVQITVENILEELEESYSTRKQSEIYKKVAYDEDLKGMDPDEATAKAMGYLCADFEENKNFIIGIDKDFVYDIYLRTK